MNLDVKVSACVSDGEEALNFMEDDNVDIVITDIKALKDLGIELAEQIRRKYHSTKVILVNEFLDCESMKYAVGCGAFCYILKPLDTDKLKRNLTAVCNELYKEQQEAEWYSAAISTLRSQFCVDLWNERIDNRINLENRFNLLNFEFEIDNINGYILEVKYLNSEEVYNRDQLVLEALRVFFRNQNVYTCMHTVEYGCYMIISDQHDFNSACLKNSVMEQCGICVSSELKFSFSSMYDFLDYDFKKEDIDIVKEIKEYIDNNYYLELSRETVAKKFFYNPNYFSRFFKLHVGVNFSDYLQNIRLNKAIDLLKSDKKISDISRAVGYRDYRYFAKKFKQNTGYTPSSYKQVLLKEGNDLCGS